MSQIEGKFDIVTTELRFILSNFVATDVYALFNMSDKKIATYMFKTRGGGGQRFFEQCSKKRLWFGGASQMREYKIRDPSNSIAYP